MKKILGLILPLFVSLLILVLIVYNWDSTKGSVKVRDEVVDASKDYGSLIPFIQDGKQGFKDKAGKVIVAPKYNAVWDFSEGLAMVRLDGTNGFLDSKYGFIDEKGKVIIDPKYDLIGNHSEGLLPVMMKDKGGFIDKTGKIVIDLKYDYVEPFKDGMAVVQLNGKRGVIDKTGKVVQGFK